MKTDSTTLAIQRETKSCEKKENCDRLWIFFLIFCCCSNELVHWFRLHGCVSGVRSFSEVTPKWRPQLSAILTWSCLVFKWLSLHSDVLPPTTSFSQLELVVDSLLISLKRKSIMFLHLYFLNLIFKVKDNHEQEKKIHDEFSCFSNNCIYQQIRKYRIQFWSESAALVAEDPLWGEEFDFQK